MPRPSTAVEFGEIPEAVTRINPDLLDIPTTREIKDPVALYSAIKRQQLLYEEQHELVIRNLKRLGDAAEEVLTSIKDYAHQNPEEWSGKTDGNYRVKVVRKSTVTVDAERLASLVPDLVGLGVIAVVTTWKADAKEIKALVERGRIPEEAARETITVTENTPAVSIEMVTKGR